MAVKSSTTILCLLLLAQLIFIVSVIPTCIKASPQLLQEEEEDSDRILNLPGQPQTPTVSQFSGYVTVNQSHGRALFYWFFEAQSQPSNKPLLLWLNGGPGCSSIGYGAASELGPLRVSKDGAALLFNNFSWNHEANLLFLESPIGVGFSYSNTSSDHTNVDDAFVAEDAYGFLVNWLERFPRFKTHDFFISGESYAGHYVPQLAELVYDRNAKPDAYPHINLKGFIVGNPETDDYYDYKGILEYAWSHAVISDEEYQKAKEVCNFNLFNWSTPCNEAMNVVFDQYKEIDIYNIYAPSCLLNKSTSSSSTSIFSENYASDHNKAQKSVKWRKRFVPGDGYDPCFKTYAEDYFNRIDVQTALHAKNIKETHTNVKWKVCNDTILQTYKNTVSTLLPVYRKLIKGGLKIWIYSGDADGRVPVIGSRYCIEALQLPLKSSWHSWYHNHQVGGRVIEYEGLSFVTVRGAGHLVPLNKPSEALALIHAFLSGQNLPITR